MRCRLNLRTDSHRRPDQVMEVSGRNVAANDQLPSSFFSATMKCSLSMARPSLQYVASGLIQSQTNPIPDLIILDWNLPDFNGIDICQRIRAHGVTTPILMLTGHDEVTDRVKALDAGVDDYLIKPFSIDELMARLRAMHRRMATFASPSEDGSGQTELLQVAELSMNTRTPATFDVGRNLFIYLSKSTTF